MHSVPADVLDVFLDQLTRSVAICESRREHLPER